MRLPAGLGDVHAGLLPSRTLHTSQGRVRVHAVGIVAATRWGGLRWLHPLHATLERSGRPPQHAWIADLTGLTLIALAIARGSMRRALRAAQRRME